MAASARLPPAVVSRTRTRMISNDFLSRNLDLPNRGTPRYRFLRYLRRRPRRTPWTGHLLYDRT